MVKSLSTAPFFTLLFVHMTISSERRERQAETEFVANFTEIPLGIPFYNGTDDPTLDDCPRSQVRLANGHCYQLLTRGPCLHTHYVVLDPITDKAYCGPRLCSPDRIFVFRDQRCYDPRDNQVCKDGRELFQTSYGTPVCQCPDGTYETDDDDSDDTACESLLAASSSCPLGQVFWFRNFSSPQECLNDPCGGENLKKPPDEHLLVPSAVDGKCYSLGQVDGVCPIGSWFTLALDQLKGVCSNLEDAGYLVFNQTDLSIYEDFFGPAIEKMGDSILPKDQPSTISHHNDSILQKPNLRFQFSNSSVPHRGRITSGVLFNRGNVEQTTPTRIIGPTYGSTVHNRGPTYGSIVHNRGPTYGSTVHNRGPTYRSIVHNRGPTYGSIMHNRGPTYGSIVPNRGFSKSKLNVIKGQLVLETIVTGSARGVLSDKTSRDIGSSIAERFQSSDVEFGDTIKELLITMSPSHRWRRKASRVAKVPDRSKQMTSFHRVPRSTVLPHFAPGNIFDTRLIACKAGAKRDVNAKCRDTILPPRAPTNPKPGGTPMSSNTNSSDQQSLPIASPPVDPKPSCPPGRSYNIQRLCVITSDAINSIVAHKLG